MDTDFHDGAQAGYKTGYTTGYNQALFDVARMLKDDFPDPNPLAHLFKPYVITEALKAIENMQKG